MNGYFNSMIEQYNQLIPTCYSREKKYVLKVNFFNNVKSSEIVSLLKQKLNLQNVDLSYLVFKKLSFVLYISNYDVYLDLYTEFIKFGIDAQFMKVRRIA